LLEPSQIAKNFTRHRRRENILEDLRNIVANQATHGGCSARRADILPTGDSHLGLRLRNDMAKKPANLIYGVDDKPPLTETALLGLQHVFVMTSGWVLVVVIVTAIGGTQEEVANVLRMSMIASGIATILQSLPNSPIGSGYFCPISSGPAYVSASILAGKIGGGLCYDRALRPVRGTARSDRAATTSAFSA
jgi:hypothetical protein